MSVNSGDTVWLLVSSALVMLMTPGVALFYGGMVRRKNVLSTMMMSFAILGVIAVLWVLYGYSFAFGVDHGGFIGGFDFVGLRGVGQAPSAIYAPTVPHLAFMVFQGMFAIVTVALVTGSVVERMKFGALMLFAVLWFTLVYCPVAHWVWGQGGWLGRLGTIDFAGGIVVHITAGFSALALVSVLGPRKGFLEGETMNAHNIPMVALGAALLWFGWFGFNGGSALTSGGLATSAFVATNISGAAGAATWMIISWRHRRPTLIGVASGAVAGLAAITPGAGYVSPLMGIPIGIVASVVCYYSIALKTRRRIDESLDVWAVHGMGGAWGVLATGLFASLAVNPAGANGAVFGNGMQLVKELAGIGAVLGYSFGVTWLLSQLVHKIVGLRVSLTEETVGLDIAQHGERAYGGLLR
jgi:Amt family ammonium transporter